MSIRHQIKPSLIRNVLKIHTLLSFNKSYASVMLSHYTADIMNVQSTKSKPYSPMRSTKRHQTSGKY